jgi:peroxiredoxin Q/BCP
MIKINELAVDFCLKNQNNENVCLKDFMGKWVVLYFYPKDNTPGCSLEAKSFSDYINEFKQLNARIIGISPDSSDSHKKFEKKHNLTFNLLSDPNHDVLKSYDVWKPKKLYGREFMGVIRSTFLIDTKGRIVHIWPKVKVMGHAHNVMNKLKELKK